MRRIAAVTCMLGKQGLPLRGNDETAESHNKGNFLECMGLLQKFDPFLQHYTAPSNSTYLSPVSQNEMIECCSKEVTATFIKEMHESKMFAIMADEARDGHTEQLAICVRYVTEGTVKERFLSLTELRSFDAKSITEALERKLQEEGIAQLKCVAQTYDGAAVMSGAAGGVQSLFREKHPEAIYVHCYAHELNLVLCHTCRGITEAAEFFSLLESLYSFFSVSLVSHHKFKEAQAKLGLQPCELVQLSNTRWACQLHSVNAVLENLPAIIDCLSALNTATAVGLKTKICKFSFVYLLSLFKDLLSVVAGLHKYLQKETIDLPQAVAYKDAVCDSLKQKRSDPTAADIYARAKAVCKDNDIVVEEQLSGQRQKKKRMDDFVVETTYGAHRRISTDAQQVKTKLLYPCLDRMITELENRFSAVNGALLQGIQACSPVSENFLSESHLEELAHHYNIDLKTEEVALTVPVSSCSCERSFSALRRLRNWLRRTMGQSRLHQLAVMAIEKDVVEQLDHDKIINRFATLKERRHRLMLPMKDQ
ncbi:Zinc finger MYM-type protein 1 [Anabarilius grahami]|uniref:Zinc finger MYM-type protein 1 n=1 Tax=Anabarilius grahami TaxID=495550 RepID=A0A3N0XF02_ANAGA|nr:Zinc finger MYM-type protein 1 [Anabarilius grahami]